MSSRFGFSTEPSAGGEYLPVVKYDARAGRLFRVDRSQDGNGEYANDPVDISDTFKAMVDFENVETGWILFNAGVAPDFRMVPLGAEFPARPTDQYKNGIRFMLKLAPSCGGDKPIREVAGTSKAFLSAVEKVFVDYENAKAENPGKLPVIAMKGAKPVTSGQGAKKSTNYVPTFELVGWAPRGDLVFMPKGGLSAAQPSQAQDAPKVPPSTGSTVATPPKAAAPVAALADDDEFG